MSHNHNSTSKLFGNIPSELRDYHNWVVWKLTTRKGEDKPTKIPFNPNTGKAASSTDAATWADFDTAVKAYQTGGYSGIGFVFTGTPFTGIDLDHCLIDGVPEPWAAEIVNHFCSYAERTPSGNGLHIIVKANMPAGRNRTGNIEMYQSGRYFTVTGDKLLATPSRAEERQSELDAFHAETFPTQQSVSAPAPRQPVTMADADLIDRARNASNGASFAALWAGDTTGYPSHSEADMALCCSLAFWTGGDAAKLDNLFRQSGLYREKWERQDYRERTIQGAIENTTEFFKPGRAYRDHIYIEGIPLTSEAQTASKRNNSVTESVTNTPLERNSVTAETIVDWIRSTSGWFSYDEIDREFDIKTPNDKANRRNIVKRLIEKGLVERHGKNNKLLRYVVVVPRTIDFKRAGNRTPLDIRFPFGIETLANTYPGNIIVVAGDSNAGKTAFLLNVVRMNMGRFQIYYQSSEMGENELANRLSKFEGIDLEDWDFHAEERGSNFHDVIRPDCVNIVDYMEFEDNAFYMISDNLKRIHDKLAGGIAIVAVQKKRGQEIGRGGDLGMEKPRLYLTMDVGGQMNIRKAKNWANPEENPNGLQVKYKIVQGCQFIQDTTWYKEEK